MLDFKDKKITVMGLGLHGGGLAVTKFLVKKGARVTVTDLKTKQQLADSLAKLNGLKIKLVLGRHDKKDFENADMIIKNPGVPRESPFILLAQKKKIPIENEASLFFKLCPAPIIAVTGTRGKSTTTTLIYEIIRRQNPQALIAGNIRTVAMFDIIEKVKPQTPVILELSSWQLEELGSYKISPHIGVFTNLLPDHLNRYQGMTDYLEAKKAIYKYQTQADHIVLNYDNPITKNLVKEVKSQCWWFSLKPLKSGKGVFVRNQKIYFKDSSGLKLIAQVGELKLSGEHNLQNALAAICVAKIAKVPQSIIIKALKEFKGIPYRQEVVREYKGILYINDTTATTPDAAMAALETISRHNRPIVLLSGGSDKNLDFKDLAKVIETKAKTMILFSGQATDKLIKELDKIKSRKTRVIVNSMPEAFKEAKKVLAKGDIFLLSPAAASFGLFLNEFDRGDQFNQQVAKIK